MDAIKLHRRELLLGAAAALLASRIPGPVVDASQYTFSHVNLDPPKSARMFVSLSSKNIKSVKTVTVGGYHVVRVDQHGASLLVELERDEEGEADGSIRIEQALQST